MEAIHDPGQSSVSWVARLLQVLQPLSLRADRLAGIQLFAGLRWSDLEFVAERLPGHDDRFEHYACGPRTRINSANWSGGRRFASGSRPRRRRGAGVADRRIKLLKQSRARRPSWRAT